MSYGSQAPKTSEHVAASTHISYNDIIGADRGDSNLFRLRIWRAKPTGMEETAIELATINPTILSVSYGTWLSLQEARLGRNTQLFNSMIVPFALHMCT